MYGARAGFPRARCFPPAGTRTPVPVAESTLNRLCRRAPGHESRFRTVRNPPGRGCTRHGRFRDGVARVRERRLYGRPRDSSFRSGKRARAAAPDPAPRRIRQPQYYLVRFGLQRVHSGRLHHFLLLLHQKFLQPDRRVFDFAVELLHVLEARPTRTREHSGYGRMDVGFPEEKITMLNVYKV